MPVWENADRRFYVPDSLLDQKERLAGDSVGFFLDFVVGFPDVVGT